MNMNFSAQMARAQDAFDNQLPPEYYEDPTALEKAHQRARDDFIDEGYLCIASIHQLKHPTPGRTEEFGPSEIFSDTPAAYLFAEFLQAYAGGDKGRREAAAQALADVCFECADAWIKENVNEKYGAES